MTLLIQFIQIQKNKLFYELLRLVLADGDVQLL